MSKIVKKICPITGSDEITIKLLDPNELVITQRKGSDGKYRRTEKPRKEVRTPLIELSCTSLDIPVFAGFTWEEQRRLSEEGKTWCKKRRDICPIEEISGVNNHPKSQQSEQ
jgi:hypothetical protein